jgi:hypothetical protein
MNSSTLDENEPVCVSLVPEFADNVSETDDRRNEDFRDPFSDDEESDSRSHVSEKKSKRDPLFDLPDHLEPPKPKVPDGNYTYDYDREVWTWITMSRLKRAFSFNDVDPFDLTQLLMELKKCEQYWYFNVLEILAFWQQRMVAEYNPSYETRLVLVNKFLRQEEL